MLRWFAYVLLLFAIGAGGVLLVAMVSGKGNREIRMMLLGILVVGLIVASALLVLVRMVPVLAF